MGDIFSGLNQTDKAEEMYNQALRIDPDYLLPQAKMAYLRKDISKLEQSARQHPQEAVFPYYLSLLYRQQTKIAKLWPAPAAPTTWLPAVKNCSLCLANC